MKTIYLMRHSIKESHGDAQLSEEGVAFAKQIGESVLRDKQFTHAYVSTLQRTLDTYNAIAEGAGDCNDLIPGIFPLHDVGATPAALDLWANVCNAAEKRGEDMLLAALQENGEVSTQIAEAASTRFYQWIDQLPEGATVLVIHHSPFLELLAFGLFGVTMKQLQPCEGFQVVANGNSLQYTEVR